MTLDRKNPLLGYSPDNCRWATDQTQRLNKRTNIIWNGKLRTVKAIAEEIGVPRTSLNKLFRKMGDIELAAREALARRKA